jgi:hypothetical protein
MLNSRIYPVAPSTASQVSSTTSGAVNTAVKFFGPPPPDKDWLRKAQDREKMIKKTSIDANLIDFINYLQITGYYMPEIINFPN